MSGPQRPANTHTMDTIEQNLPSKADLVRLINAIRPERGYWAARHGEPISDEIQLTEEAAIESEERADGAVPVSVQLTVGWSPESGSWDYQTGDNSYTGGAYGHPVWAVSYVTANSNADEIAEEILNELAEQTVY